MLINQTIVKYPNNPLFSVNIGYDFEETFTYNVYVNTSSGEIGVIPDHFIDHFEVPFDNIATYEEAYVLAQLVCDLNNLEFAGNCGSCPFNYTNEQFLVHHSEVDLSSISNPNLFICFNNEDKNGFFIYAYDYRSKPIILGGYYKEFNSALEDAAILAENLKLDFLGLKHLDIHNYI